MRRVLPLYRSLRLKCFQPEVFLFSKLPKLKSYFSRLFTSNADGTVQPSPGHAKVLLPRFVRKPLGSFGSFGLLVAGLIIVTLLTALSGLWEYQYELAHQPPAVQSAAQVSAATKTTLPNLSDAGEKTVAARVVSANNQLPSLASTKLDSPSHVTYSQANQAASIATAASTPTASQPTTNTAPVQPVTISLTLSINGQAKGLVKLATGSDQCDVLTQALADGLISSLDMVYDSPYNTEAVYVIDGIGDPGSVWWTYTVNGSSPPYGCAHVTVHNGDSVNWQYVKN
jgi:hypothetical protein